MSDQVSWAKKEIALSQLEVQETLLKRSLLQVELNLRPESNRETWAFREELKGELSLLRAMRKELQDLPCRREKPWSKIIMKIYAWATKERFDF